MRTIKLTQRTARMLRDNLTNNQDGYDYVDLCRLDHLAKKLTVLQGAYSERMAELAREEKSIRRQLVRDGDLESANRKLGLLTYEVEDLHEAAEEVEVELKVEDGDHKLISNKLEMVGHWLGSDEMRHLVISMVESVRNAESDEPAEEQVEPRSIRRR